MHRSLIQACNSAAGCTNFAPLCQTALQLSQEALHFPVSFTRQNMCHHYDVRIKKKKSQLQVLLFQKFRTWLCFVWLLYVLEPNVNHTPHSVGVADLLGLCTHNPDSTSPGVMTHLNSLHKTRFFLTVRPCLFLISPVSLEDLSQQLCKFHRSLFNKAKLFGEVVHKLILTVTKLTRRGHHKVVWGSSAPLSYVAHPSGPGFILAHAQQHVSLAVGSVTPLSQQLCRLLDKPGRSHAAKGHKASSPSTFTFLLLNMNLWPDDGTVHPPFALEQ